MHGISSTGRTQNKAALLEMTTRQFWMTMTMNTNNSLSFVTESFEELKDSNDETALRAYVTLIGYSRILTAIVFAGILVNILNLLTLRRKQFRAVFYVCLRALAVADLLALLVVAPYTINLYSAKPKSTYPEAFYSAHVQIFLMKFFEGASVLTVVLMTIERYIALSMPLRAKSLLTKKRIVTGLIISWIIAFSFNIPRVFEREIDTQFDIDTNSTLYTSGHISDFAKGTYYTVHKYLYMALFRVVASLIIIVINVRIVIRIRRSAVERAHVLTSSTTARSISNKETRVTFMLLGVTALFLFSYIPPLYTYVVQGWNLSYIAFVFFVASDVAAQLNFSMNFFVYCCCSKEFTLSLRDTLRCVSDNHSGSSNASCYRRDNGTFSKTRDDQQKQSVETISSIVN